MKNKRNLIVYLSIVGAALFLGKGLIKEEEYLSKEHKNWTENIESNRSRNKESILEELTAKEILQKAKGLEQGEVVRKFSLDPKLKRENLDFYAMANEFSVIRIPEICLELERYTNGLTGDKIGFAMDLTKKAISDERYKEFLRDTLRYREMDCKAFSSTLVAASLLSARLFGEEIKVGIVTGIYFSEENKKGIGHQWAQIEGRILDSAGNVRRSAKIEPYIPLFETEIRYSGRGKEGKKRRIIHYLPNN